MHRNPVLLQHGVLNLQNRTAMLRLGNQIRLTRPEAEVFFRITNFEPVDVRTVSDLKAYVMECKRHYWGTSHATRLLHRLIDLHLVGCIQGHAPGQSPLLAPESLARLSRRVHREASQSMGKPSDAIA